MVALNTSPCIVDTCETSGAHRLLVRSIAERGGVKFASAAGDQPQVKKAAAYADMAQQMWPLDTKDQVLEAAVSIELQRGDLTGRRYERLNHATLKAASFHGILIDMAVALASLKLEQVGSVKQASTQFALPQASKFPIDSDEAVKSSAEQFTRIRHNYPYPWRKQAAAAMLDAAASRGIQLQEPALSLLEASAGLGLGEAAHVARKMASLSEQVYRYSSDVAAALMATAIKVASADTSDIPATRELMAMATEVIDRVEDRFNLRHGDSQQLPEDIAFAITPTKMASVVGTFVDIGESIYVRQDIAGLKAKSFTAFGHSFPGKIASAANPELVDPAKFAEHTAKLSSDVLGRVLRGFGVAPVAAVPRQASIVQNPELARWARVGQSYSSRPAWMNGNALEYSLSGDTDAGQADPRADNARHNKIASEQGLASA